MDRSVYRHHSEQGAIAVLLMLILTVALIAVTGLVVDFGRILIAIREAQSAADSAALAGATELMWARQDQAWKQRNEDSSQIRCGAIWVESKVNGLLTKPPGMLDNYYKDNILPVTSEQGGGWFRVKSAVLAALKVSRLSAIDSVARAALDSGVSREFPFTQDGATWDFSSSVGGPSTSFSAITAEKGNLKISVERGRECRKYPTTISADCQKVTEVCCTSAGECERQFFSFERDGILVARRLADWARAVQVKIRISNLNLFFAKFFRSPFFDHIEVTSLASMDDYDSLAGDPGGMCVLTQDRLTLKGKLGDCSAWRDEINNQTLKLGCLETSDDEVWRPNS